MTDTVEKFNNDELEPPSWLDKGFFKEVLQKYENDFSKQLSVKELKLSPGSGQGDHYASVMFRANINYTFDGQDKTISLIIKTMPEVDSLKKELLKNSYIFETEIGMYEKVIPKLEQILRKAGDNTVLGAPCVYYSLSPKKVIIFKDICPDGYNVVRDHPPNIDEVKSAYTKIAKWHAVSYKIALEDPTFFDDFRNSLWSIPDFEKGELITTSIDNFIDILDRTPTLTRFRPYFEKIRYNYLEKCKASFSEYRDNHQKDAYYVLCHGDFHFRNMMFKYNALDGKVDDCMLLDFQLSYVGPIGNDILYSIYMILDTELRQTKLDELLYFYFTTFIATLKKIKFNGELPKYVEFRRQQMRHKIYELFLIISFLPMMNGFTDNTVNPEEIMENNDVRRSLYNSKYYMDEMHYLLPKLLHLGYFEDL